MNIRAVKLLLLLGLFSCCTPNGNKENSELECTVEIRNKDLIEAITDYQDFLYKDKKKYIEQGDSIYVGIASKDINDSIYRYVVFPVYDISDIKYHAPFDLCKVNGHYVIFSHDNAHPIFPIERRFCRITDSAVQEYAKLLFPKEYEMLNKKEKHVIRLYEPKNCYLTFFGDSLIDKTNKQGMIRDAIPIMQNGEEVYL
jgi:hypothetical protein